MAVHNIDNLTLSLLISGRLQEIDWKSFSETEWESLISKAQREGVAPLVYWTFSKARNLSNLPLGIRNQLRSAYAGIWMQNQRMFKELETIARLFDQAGIEVVALKGVCVALTIYPDIGLRPMGDMDLLVSKEHLADAVQIAESLGYMDCTPDASPGLKDLLSHHVGLQKTGSQPLTLEIHDRLVGEDAFSFSVPVDWFWEQTEQLISSSFGQFDNLLMLTPAAQVMYASSHAMLQHGGKDAPLRWFYDIDLLIRTYQGQMDWSLLLSQAKIFEWSSALHAALTQTVAYFDTPVPNHVLAELWQNVDRHHSLVALKQTRPATNILLEFQKLSSLNWHGRIRLVLALIVPSPSYMRWRYQLKNSWQLLAYYPFRWWVILKDAVRTVIELFKRAPVKKL